MVIYNYIVEMLHESQWLHFFAVALMETCLHNSCHCNMHVSHRRGCAVVDANRFNLVGGLYD